jgi:hypothetical protein
MEVEGERRRKKSTCSMLNILHTADGFPKNFKSKSADYTVRFIRSPSFKKIVLKKEMDREEHQQTTRKSARPR